MDGGSGDVKLRDGVQNDKDDFGNNFASSSMDDYRYEDENQGEDLLKITPQLVIGYAHNYESGLVQG